MTWRCMMVHRNRRAPGSMPVLGSSSSTTGGLPTKATATLSFLLFPPENVSHALHHLPPLLSTVWRDGGLHMGAHVLVGLPVCCILPEAAVTPAVVLRNFHHR